jgi:O-antigen ligase
MLTKLQENIFYLFIFILPWQTVFILKEVFINREKFQYGTIGVYLFQLILFIWIILNFKKIFTCAEKKLIYILGVYLLWLLLTIFWSDNKSLALSFFCAHFLGVLLFLIIQSSAINFKKFSFSLISSATLGSILGLYHFFSQTTFANKWLGLSEHPAWQGGSSVIGSVSFRFLRAYGNMPHPNILGGFLVVILILSLGAYLKASKAELRWKMFLITTLPINLLALLTTFSRSAILTLLFGIFSIVFYFLIIEKSPKKKDLLVIFYTLLILFFIFFTAYSNLISSRTNTQSRLEKKSLDDREIYLEESKKIINKNFIKGVGLGNYTEFVSKNLAKNKEPWNIQPVHNVYLLIFSELGLIGFSIFMFFIIFNILEIFKLIKERNTNRVIFSIILISLILISFFDHWLWTTSFGIIIFWLVLGFSKEKDLKYL